MRSNYQKTFRTAVFAVTILLLGASLAAGQVTVNLTAGPMNATLPDGSIVPMWGYSCNGVTGSGATCAALNPAANTAPNVTSTTIWSPIVISVPSGQLTINLKNNLPVPPGAPSGIPTSLTIVGQLGGGLGTSRTTTPSPTHSPQTLTWPASSTDLNDGANTPPPQGPRVQSFASEVAAGTTVNLPPWANLQAGTYLLESGTHPSIQGPMGLYGMLVVTNTSTSPATAYPGVTYNADIPMLFSEIDPVQNNAVAKAVGTTGFSETAVWSGKAGACGDITPGAPQTCYPPAVNYSPLYYLINGVAFDKSNASRSLFPTAPTNPAVGGTVLVRMVNAGLRMHIPSIVGAQTGTPAVPGFGLIAEDGNPLPGKTRVQSQVFMAAGKTYDVTINVPAGGTALPIYDRQLSLSSNATSRDAGMLAYISANGASLPGAAAIANAQANGDTYNSLVLNQTLTVSDPGKGVIANDVNVYGVKVVGGSVTGGTLTLNTDGTFTFAATAASGGFDYCGNGATSPSPACAHVTLGALANVGGVSCTPGAFTANTAKRLVVTTPGVLANCTDSAGYPLTVDLTQPVTFAGGTVYMDVNGGFTATVPAAGGYGLSFTVKNSVGQSNVGNALVTFPTPNGPTVTVLDGLSRTALDPQDYRWIIEEDRTFYVDPNCQTNPLNGGCPTVTPAGTAAVFGTNFHSSYMPIVAQGCTGTLSCEGGQTQMGVAVACDQSNGVCHDPDPITGGQTPVDPSQVLLDTSKRYYISVLPGDAMDPGHAMGGASLVYVNGAWQNAVAALNNGGVNILVAPENQKAANLSVFVFEDDHPLNGEHDAGGGVDILSPNEPGLGGFNITIIDLVGMSGDSAGQLTYDEFNQPLSNALAGTIDPVTQLDACPITANPSIGADQDPNNPSPTGITGVIPVCPQYEADGATLSPLGGQAIVANLPPGRYGIIATPAADRISRGEEWLQTNTLDGGKDHEAFLKNNEPRYFQEFGPAGYHVSIGFANPQWINDAGNALCSTTACNESVTGKITGVHMSRPSDERLYGTGTNDTFGYTQCYISLGSPDGADIRFTKCNSDGTFTLANIPQGDWKVTFFDQWNDVIVDGISTPVRVGAGGTDMGEVSVHAWKNNLSTRTCFDVGATGNPADPGYGDGVCQDSELGLALVPTNIRYRDGSISNLNSTDLEGFAGFNEVFPIFAWYVLETDSTRYKNTGTHVINDAGGPVDNSTGPYGCGKPGFPSCGDSATLANLARTAEDFSLPVALRVPGAKYCLEADCPTPGNFTDPSTQQGSTGRVDPAWATSYGWQSFMGQNQMLEFGKRPFQEHENGGIRGHVVYTSTRPFDDPSLLLQLTWEPLVPHVTINLYKEGFAADGVTPTLTKVDTTTTSSWDDWAQGFYPNGKPYMSCPGQDPADPFYDVTLKNQPSYLNWYDSHHGGTLTAIPNGSQYKCYDGMHNWNQLQPAPYDGMYKFPSITGRDPSTGVFTGTNCTACTTGPDGEPMLAPGKYVVEMIVPPGYELVKEEDKNILLGDTYEAPVTQQFAGFGNIFIIPDQASVAAAYNPNNPLIPNTNEGVVPRHEGDTGSVETFWPCVGTRRIVPDFMSLYPQSGQNAPFAGATRPLCDRKEVMLEDQMSVLAKFYVFTSAHVAAHFTGIITDDFTSEFDPFSPAFGEKFAPANLPVSVKDWAGNEISRVYSDSFGMFNGLTYSSFSVNPPDPSGYIPQMMVMCMNDRGGNGTTPDPLYQAAYSQFCYEWSFMPGQTSYLDTPVIPTAAFAPNYNHPDCAYPDATPAVAYVEGDGGIGSYVSASGHTLKIHALGDQQVNNYAYSGPGAKTPPFNQKTITRHYGFGSSQGLVTIGGLTAPVTSWGDSEIDVTVPAGVAPCAVQQQQQFGGPGAPGIVAARCGELVIRAANGKQSVDTVTVTIGGKAPTRLVAGQTIQSAIDAAEPGDLIIVPQGIYHELVIMWKPVRLQGVGAGTTVIDANSHPSGILNDWRLRMVCLFGLAPTGVPDGYDPSCGSGLHRFTTATTAPEYPQVDRLPLEATVGWDASLNGNLAEQLQEPTLLGAYEGAGVTVIAKGVRVPDGANPWTDGAEPAGFPTGTDLLGTSGRDCGSGDGLNNNNRNRFPSSFQCNPSSIDALSVTNSSQGGGGIFVHGWAHNLQIANNRVYNNQGTLAGGITVGQGEHPPALLAGAGATNADPGSCQNGGPPNTQLPYCFDRFVNVHNNAILLNASEGDELFAATPSGAGGIAFCTGADNYQFNYNWVCGNLSTGDGAGVSQMGFVYNGSVQHNAILFNQSTNPTTPSNGGGLLIMSAPDTDPTCPGGDPDQDCNHAYGTVGDGIGPGLVVNANLIMGNAAEAGSGGGMRFQGVNGIEVSTFPNNPSRWYFVNVTNNIIANNVAGWDGGGVSLQDSIGVNLINNTIISNDSTATSGTLFGAFFAGQTSAPTPCPRDAQGANIPCTVLSTPQPAGVSAAGHSAEFTASLPGQIKCPQGHPINSANPGSTSLNDGVVNGACRYASFPELYNDVLWQNRAFNIVVPQVPGSGQQQVAVTLTPTPSPNLTTTGQCWDGAYYWDLGLRGDTTTAGGNHLLPGSVDVRFQPKASVLTDITGYSGGPGVNLYKANTSDFAGNKGVVREICNGSKIPPEAGGAFYVTPPGTNEGNVPVPVFSMTAGATVDEGNNWVNISWGPLSLITPTSETNPSTETFLADYTLQSTATTAIGYIVSPQSSVTYAAAPATDFFDHSRKFNNSVDAGAVEFFNGAVPTLISISPTSGARGTAVPVTLTGTNFQAGATVAVSGGGIAITGTTVVNATTITATFAISSGTALGDRDVTVTSGAVTTSAVSFTVVNPPAPTLASINPTSGVRGSAVPVTLTGTNFVNGATIGVSGGGFNVTGVTVVDSSHITATFNINSGAALGNHNVTVTTAGGTTGSVLFRVLGATISFSALNLTTNPANTSIKNGFVTVTNTASGVNAGALTLTAAPTVIKASGPGASSFSVIAGGTCVSGSVVNPGGSSCTVRVQYNPGGSTATSTAHVRITGRGIDPNPLNGPNTISGN